MILFSWINHRDDQLWQCGYSRIFLPFIFTNLTRAQSEQNCTLQARCSTLLIHLRQLSWQDWSSCIFIFYGWRILIGVYHTSHNTSQSCTSARSGRIDIVSISCVIFMCSRSVKHLGARLFFFFSWGGGTFLLHPFPDSPPPKTIVLVTTAPVQQP